ncbi:MAG TPA: CHAT domain-containing protein, partial [Blastocatellia bacterium]|nr:CHAT domain-containing protein [Blastocatellia bacterium]
DLEGRIRSTSPRFASLTQPRTLTLAEIQKDVLDPKTVLLEYSLGKERSYLWFVSSDSLSSFELPGRGEVEKSARLVYELLTARSRSYKNASEKSEALSLADTRYREAAASLSRMVLGPVADRLKGKRLLIVAEGALQFIPFGALPAPAAGRPRQYPRKPTDKVRGGRSPRRLSARPLIADHEIVSLPSASALAFLRRETAGRKPAPNLVAVIADPVFDNSDVRLESVRSSKMSETRGVQSIAVMSVNSAENSALRRSADETGVLSGSPIFNRLPFTRLEARYILAASPAGASMRALDFDANKKTATSPELSKYRIVHFATHALLNNRHPQLSGLVLSLVNQRGEPQDGFLRLHEIYNMSLSADMVVLSGCQTALGKDIKGEGIVGLTRGFMYAGATRVMASLWKVDDDATAELMRLYYNRKIKSGLTPAGALRSAELAMWKRGTWKSPFYWAGFVIYGEWK